jgi:uncharacterized membrane protein HdeD (DUF308 family)
VTLIATPDAATIQAKWKAFLVFGVVLAVLGAVALMNVIAATLVTTVIVGGLLMVAGITQLIGIFTLGGSLGQKLLFGVLAILYVVVGFNMVTEPLRGVVTLTIIVGVFLLVQGIVRIFSAFGGGGSKGFAIFTGFIDILLGLWLLTGIPVSGIALGFFVGIELVITGISWMFMSLRLRHG